MDERMDGGQPGLLVSRVSAGGRDNHTTSPILCSAAKRSSTHAGAGEALMHLPCMVHTYMYVLVWERPRDAELSIVASCMHTAACTPSLA